MYNKNLVRTTTANTKDAKIYIRYPVLTTREFGQKYHNSCDKCGKLFWTEDAFLKDCKKCR